MSLPLRPALENVTSLDRVLEDLLVRFIINCPPEDLASVERELFHFEEASWFYIDFVKLMNPTLPSLKIKSFAQNIIRLCPLVWKWDIKADEALQKFSKYKKSIPVRGAAIFNEKLNKILLVQGTESDSWSFPRGKISKDEDDVACCIREVKEEIGFDLTDHIDENQFIERNIQGKNYKIFLVSGVPEDYPFKPQVRNEINKIEWRDFKKMTKSMFKSNVKYYLVNSMIRPLSMWIRRQKQIKGDDQLKQYAEEQLKLLLGITKEEQVDPGRELLNMLHSAVHSKDETSETLPDGESSMQEPMVPLPSTSDSNPSCVIPGPPGFPPAFTQNLPPLMGFQPFAPFPFINGTIPYVNPHMMQHGISSVPVSNMEAHIAPLNMVSTPDASSLSKPIMASEQEMVKENDQSSSKQLLDLLNTKRKSLKSNIDRIETEPQSNWNINSHINAQPNSVNQIGISNQADSLALLNILKNPVQLKNERPLEENLMFSKEFESNDNSTKEQAPQVAAYDTGDDTYEDFEDSSDEEYSKRQSEEENSDDAFNYEDFESASELEQEEKVEDLQKEERDVNSVDLEALKANRFSDGDVPHKDERTESAKSINGTLAPQDSVKPKPKFKLLKRGENLEDILNDKGIGSSSQTATLSKNGLNPQNLQEISGSQKFVLATRTTDAPLKNINKPPSEKQISPEEELMNMLQKSQLNTNVTDNSARSEQTNSSTHLLGILKDASARKGDFTAVGQNKNDIKTNGASENDNQTASSELLGLLKRPTNGNSEITRSTLMQPSQNTIREPFIQNDTSNPILASNTLLDILHKR